MKLLRFVTFDITLARALGLQEKLRPDLKLVVMSATLETGVLEKYLAPSRTLTSAGRTFTVEMEYLERSIRADEFPIWDAAANELEAQAARTPGDEDGLGLAHEVSAPSLGDALGSLVRGWDATREARDARGRMRGRKLLTNRR